MKLFLLLMLVGCASPKPYAELYLVYEPEGLQDEILKQHRGTPGNQWKGQNPYITGEAGFEWPKHYRIGIESGTSLFVGAPFNRSTPEELYWLKVKFGKKWGGY